jgi:hypothetical protein
MKSENKKLAYCACVHCSVFSEILCEDVIDNNKVFSVQKLLELQQRSKGTLLRNI